MLATLFNVIIVAVIIAAGAFLSIIGYTIWIDRWLRNNFHQSDHE